MLFEGVQHWYEVLSISISALLGLFGIAAGLNGYLFTKINPIFRIAGIAAGICMMIPGVVTDIIGFVVVAAIIVVQKFLSKKVASEVPA